MEIVLVLPNIRSAYNVGAILRTAEGFGVKKVIFSGVTPRPDDSEKLPHVREKVNHMIHKTALGAEEMLELYSSHDIISDLEKLRKDGFIVAGLENNLEKSQPIALSNPHLSDHLSSKTVLVLGEEVHGIPPEICDYIDLFLEIPMKGQKESFNVSVAAGIALFVLSNPT